MARHKHIDEAEVMKALRSGATYSIVSDRFGCSEPRISQIARKHGYDAMAAWKARRDEERVAREAAPPPPILHPADLATRPPVGLPTDVPAWAARADLAADYRDLRRQFGEDHAARECRKLTAELRRQEALDSMMGRAP
ncbi:hypothetical protein [Methylorubrum aminovorans]|uniref:hypothetical protein n=1 Tax=Methylorubrum aminovorans TaxID=269069 RepID=UPI003C2F98F5